MRRQYIDRSLARQFIEDPGFALDTCRNYVSFHISPDKTAPLFNKGALFVWCSLSSFYLIENYCYLCNDIDSHLHNQ